MNSNSNVLTVWNGSTFVAVSAAAAIDDVPIDRRKIRIAPAVYSVKDGHSELAVYYREQASDPTQMVNGQLAINLEIQALVCFKDDNGDLVKTGPAHVDSTAQMRLLLERLAIQG